MATRKRPDAGDREQHQRERDEWHRGLTEERLRRRSEVRAEADPRGRGFKRKRSAYLISSTPSPPFGREALSAQPRKSPSGQDGGHLRRQKKAADHPEQHRSPKHPSFVSRPGDGRQQSREGNLSPRPEVHSIHECGRDHKEL